MIPYKNIRLRSGDIGDIQSDGRASHVGRLPEKSGVYKSYTRNAVVRRAIRRYLKRVDRRVQNSFDVFAG